MTRVVLHLLFNAKEHKDNGIGLVCGRPNLLSFQKNVRSNERYKNTLIRASSYTQSGLWGKTHIGMCSAPHTHSPTHTHTHAQTFDSEGKMTMPNRNTNSDKNINKYLLLGRDTMGSNG